MFGLSHLQGRSSQHDCGLFRWRGQWRGRKLRPPQTQRSKAAERAAESETARGTSQSSSESLKPETRGRQRAGSSPEWDEQLTASRYSYSSVFNQVLLLRYSDSSIFNQVLSLTYSYPNKVTQVQLRLGEVSRNWMKAFELSPEVT